MRVAIFVSVLACLAGSILAKGYGGGGGGVYGYGKGYNSGGYGKGYNSGGYGGYGGGGYGGYGGGGYGGYGGGGYGGYGSGGYGGYGSGGYGGYGGGGYGGYGSGGYGGYGDGKGYSGYGDKGYGKGKGIYIPGRTYSYSRYSVFRDPKLAYYVPYPMPLPTPRHTYTPAAQNDNSLLWRIQLENRVQQLHEQSVHSTSAETTPISILRDLLGGLSSFSNYYLNLHQ